MRRQRRGSTRQAWLTLFTLLFIAPRLCLVQGPPNRPEFKARVDAVNVDVLVMKDGEPVRGLTVGNFEVRDNGVLQVVKDVSVEGVQLDVSCIVAPAARNGLDQLPTLLKAGEAVRDALAEPDHVQVVPLVQPLRVLEFTGGRSLDFASWMDAVPSQRGLVPTRDAVFVALAARHPHPGRFVIVLFSDGFDSRSWSTAAQLRELAQRSDAVIYVLMAERFFINAGWVKAGVLNDLAQDTGGRVLPLGGNGVKDSLVRLFQEMRSRYVVSYVPSDSAQGWHRLEVSLKGASGRVTARRGYFFE